MIQEIPRPDIAWPPRPTNPEFWAKVDTTVKSGKSIKVSDLSEAGYSSLKSLRTAARARARRQGLHSHISKTGDGYAVWFSKR